jgi:hypothetical protein
MAFSKLEKTQLAKEYGEKFGSLPEGIRRHAANQGQHDRLYDAMKWALDNNQLPNWNNYVTPFARRPEPV